MTALALDVAAQGEPASATEPLALVQKILASVTTVEPMKPLSQSK